MTRKDLNKLAKGDWATFLKAFGEHTYPAFSPEKLIDIYVQSDNSKLKDMVALMLLLDSRASIPKDMLLEFAKSSRRQVSLMAMVALGDEEAQRLYQKIQTEIDQCKTISGIEAMLRTPDLDVKACVELSLASLKTV